MRYLAFGDSLTAGMTNGHKDYPPAAFIQRLLGEKHIVVQEGIGGDLLEDMPRRLRTSL